MKALPGLRPARRLGLPTRGGMLLALAVLASAPHAHLLENTPEVASQTTVLVEVGRHNACGMQFTSVDATHGDAPYPVDAWDVNLSVMRGARPGLLTGRQKTELSRIQAHGAARLPLKVLEAWFLQEGTPIAKPAGPVAPSADGRAIVTPYDGGVVLKALADAAHGEKPSFLLGIQLESETSTRIYRFTPNVSPADAKEFLACAGALLSQELAKKSPVR
jgi:hypothetical protein